MTSFTPGLSQAALQWDGVRPTGHEPGSAGSGRAGTISPGVGGCDHHVEHSEYDPF